MFPVSHLEGQLLRLRKTGNAKSQKNVKIKSNQYYWFWEQLILLLTTKDVNMRRGGLNQSECS